LIEKNQISLYDIPIAALTDQYMEVLRRFPEDMENRSAFMVMAAALLEIKSRMLLPRTEKRTEEEPDPREDLMRKLIEYRYFKQMSELLRACEEQGGRFYYRAPDWAVIRLFQGKARPDIAEILKGVRWESFYPIFMDAARRVENRTDKVRAGFKEIIKDEHLIEEKIQRLLDLLNRSRHLEFTRLFRACGGRSEKVAYFLALLELSKMKQIEIKQEDVFQDIFVDKRPD
jgi:segregation and condensation protein A